MAILSLLKNELETYVDFNNAEIPDNVVEAFIEKIVVHNSCFEWHLRIPQTNKTVFQSDDCSEDDTANFVPNDELKTSDKLLISSFLLKKEDALNYMYAISPQKRVHRWKDFTVELYA